MSATKHTSEPLLMTQGEAARLLGISRNSVVRLVRQGVLSTVVISPGGMPRVRRADVVELVERPAR